MTDELGEAWDKAVADGEGGLGRDVAQGEAGAAGGEEELSFSGCGVKCGNEDVELVGEDEAF